MPEYVNISGLLPYMNLADWKNLYSPEMANTMAYIRQLNSQPSAQLAKLSAISGPTQVTSTLTRPGINKKQVEPQTIGFLDKLKGVSPEQAMGITGAVTTGLEMIGDAVETGKGTFTKDSLTDFNEDQADAFGNYNGQVFSSSNTSDILNLAGNRPDLIGEARDIKTQKYNLGKTFSNVGKGAAAGAMFGGIGAIVGAGAGLVTDLAGQLTGIFGDKARKNRAIKAAEMKENNLAAALNAGNQRVAGINYMQGMANYLNNAAMGGPLSTHGSDFTDGLIRIDNGGTHESNPYGGVPAGIDPMGIPNLVEEGETIWDNGDEEYVFSRRLKTPKSLVKKFSLGGGKDGLTYAEASKKIAEKSGANLRPNDPISKRTKDAQLAELEESQEEKRMKIEQKKLMEALSQMGPEQLQGLFAPQPEDMQMAQQVPPQGVVEEQPVVEEPMQGEGMYEPTGFALGGQLPSIGYLDYINNQAPYPFAGTSYRTNLFYDGGLFLRINNGLKDGSVVYDPVNKTYTFMNENGSKGSTYTQREYDIIKSTYDKDQARLARKGERATARQEARAARAQAVTQRPNRQVTMPQFTTWADTRPILENRVATSRQSDVTKERQPLAANVITGVAPEYPAYLNSRFYFNSRNADGTTRNGEYYIPAPIGSRTEEVAITPENITEPVVETKQSAAKSQAAARGTAGTATKTATTPWTPNKIFSVSSIGPRDTFMQTSPLFNPVQRTAAQKAVEGIKETDPEVTASVGAQKNKLLPTWMRYAPIVGGGLSVLSNALSPEDYSDYDNLLSASRRLSRPVNIPVVTIGDRIRRNPIDERLAVNQANQNFLAGIRGTMDNAGGNRAYRQFANNLLAYNNQGALSDIATKAYLANRQDALQTADFNRGTAIQNMNAINQRNLTEAELNSRREQAGWNALAHATQLRDAARRLDDQYVSADFSGLMESLGNIGRENEQRNWLTSLANEGLFNLAYGKNGELSFVPSVTAKCGGKVKTKKRRF